MNKGWIKVEDSLPRPKKRVLVACNHGSKVGIGSYRGDSEGWWLNIGVGKITHWMPLPEPPK